MIRYLNSNFNEKLNMFEIISELLEYLEATTKQNERINIYICVNNFNEKPVYVARTK